MLCVERLSTGSFLELVLIYLKCFECFLKRFVSLLQRRSWILTFWSIFMKPTNSRWTETKIFQIFFSSLCFSLLLIYFLTFLIVILSQSLINNPESILIALLLLYCFQHLFQRHNYKNFFREAKRKLRPS